MRSPTPAALAAVLVIALAAAACSSAATPTPALTVAPTATPTAAAATATPAPTTDPCSAAALATKTAGQITIGADNPAFPPFFSDDPADPAWEFGNPKNGKGFESAVAYAIAGELGFATGQVHWIFVPFLNSFAPGPKDFDLYLSQVSYSDERAQVVDLSDGYFDLNQSVVGFADTPIASVTTVAGLKPFRLGAPVGTTSYQYIVDHIQPTVDPSVYNDLDTAVQALAAKQIDGVVVDLPTAFYLRDVELTNGTIVGRLPTVGEVPEHFSLVLAKGSPLTGCVNGAIAALKADGRLDAIAQEWITGQGAPELQ